MVADALSPPAFVHRSLLLGAARAVNDTPALATPLTVTTTLPVVAPAGTGATIEVALQLAGVATVPLNVTALVPWVEPKLRPAMVSDAPTAPELGDKLLMLGTASTVNNTPALATPLTVTTTLPVVAPAGTGATIEVALQLAGLASVALKETALAPWVEPKLLPAIVTDAPTAPEIGDKLQIGRASCRERE